MARHRWSSFRNVEPAPLLPGARQRLTCARRACATARAGIAARSRASRRPCPSSPIPSSRRTAGSRAMRRSSPLGTVRVAHARLDLGEEAFRLVRGSVETRRESVVARVRARDRFIDAGDGRDEHERQEQLGAPQRMVERRARDRRRAVVAVRQVAVVDALAAVDDPARLAQRVDLRHRVLVARDGRRIDDGPHPVLAPRGVADADLRGRAVQRGDEVGEHRVLDVHARAGRALLPRQPERGPHHAGRGIVQVRVPRHDRGVLAAHLGDARARPASVRERAVRCIPTS